MDPKLFQETLSQWAQLKRMTPAKHQGIRESEEDILSNWQGETVIINSKHNPTLPIEIKKVTLPEEPCPDCDKMVSGRCIQRFIAVTPQRHWRDRCGGCNLVKNPFTGKYTLMGANIQRVFEQFFSKKWHRDK
jgi:hypothetical protein